MTASELINKLSSLEDLNKEIYISIVDEHGIYYGAVGYITEFGNAIDIEVEFY